MPLLIDDVAIAGCAAGVAVATGGWPRNLPSLPTRWSARERMKGPSDTSNWVVPGLVLCGSQPHDNDEKTMGKILDFGITYFVCLQAEVGTKPAYQALAERLHRERGITKPLEVVMFPTKDGGTFDDQKLKDFVDQLVGKVLDGTKIYVHCRGGHGRTGVMVGCILGSLYPNLSSYGVLQRVRIFHDTRDNPQGHLLQNPGSPQTPFQRQQVERILSRRPFNFFRKVREVFDLVPPMTTLPT